VSRKPMLRCPECKYHTTRPPHFLKHRVRRHEITNENPAWFTRKDEDGIVATEVARVA
jgi:hypothetical protein